jgi:all-trans-retinol 13,14-reductase
MLSMSTLTRFEVLGSRFEENREGAMAFGISYKQAKLAEQWDAIAIGSGIGGLTAAVLLGAHAGKRVLVLERHYEAGGFTHAFHRPGYRWDVGLHYIGQMQEEAQVRRAFDHVTGGGVKWQAMPEVYDRLIIAGQRFDFAAGLERFREGLKQAFPGEVKAIDRYIAVVLACNRASGLYYAEKAIPGPLAAMVGGLMRAPYIRWARRTTREVLEGLTGNRELIGVLTAQWGDYGLPPAKSSFAVHALIAEHYFAGASYPVGGAGSIAAAMVPLIEAQGGLVVTSAEVAGIVLDGDRAVGVRMSDGREFRAGLVLSDAGAANTFERLLPADLPAMDSLRGQLRTLEPSTAHVSLYVGLKKSDAELGLNGTNLWVYPSFDHDANVERFTREFPRNGDADFAGVYLSFPSAKDPEFARQYPGRSTVEAITMAPYAAFAGWGDTRWKRRGDEYDALKARLSARLLAELERQVPAVAGNIAHAELSTPVTTQHFMNYGRGEIYGVAATPARYGLRELGARTPICGLYLTGQDVASLGVVGALFGGVVSASAALGKNLMGVVTKPLPRAALAA